MPIPDDDHSHVSLGEVYRLLLAMQTSIDRMTGDMRNDRDNAASTFVRKDVNDARMAELRDDIKELKGDRDTQKDRNRQIIIGVVSGFILMVVGIVLSRIGLQPTGGL